MSGSSTPIRLGGCVFCACLLAACGSESKLPAFNKTVPEIEERFEGKTLATWRDYDTTAPAEVRAQTAFALSELEKEPSDSVPLLLEMLDDPQPAVRLAAVIATGRLAPPSEALAARLTAFLASADEPLRRHARGALGRLGAAALDPLTAALEDERVRVRWGAVTALAGLAKAAAPAVMRVEKLAAEDENEAIRRQAVFTLARLGPDGVAVCVARLGEGSIAKRSEAAAALAAGGPDAVGPVAALLTNEDEELAARAAGILADIGPEASAALEPLLAALERAGPVRFNAAEALIALGGAAVPRLEALLASEDEGIVAIARYALGQIRGD